MTGGGFGGSVVAVTAADNVAAVTVGRRHVRRDGFPRPRLPRGPSDGARSLA